MTSKSHKPVKQCEGCILNEGDKCAVYDYPVHQWAKAPCSGYNNYELAAEYGLANDGHGSHERRSIRKTKAKYNETIQRPEPRSNFKKIKWP